jgi:hypothetical protein
MSPFNSRARSIPALRSTHAGHRLCGDLGCGSVNRLRSTSICRALITGRGASAKLKAKSGRHKTSVKFRFASSIWQLPTSKRGIAVNKCLDRSARFVREIIVPPTACPTALVCEWAHLIRASEDVELESHVNCRPFAKQEIGAENAPVGLRTAVRLLLSSP